MFCLHDFLLDIIFETHSSDQHVVGQCVHIKILFPLAGHGTAGRIKRRSDKAHIDSSFPISYNQTFNDFA